MKAPILPLSQLKFFALLICCSSISFSIYFVKVSAQSTCTPGNTPGTSRFGRLDAWGQNTLVSVNINSNDFTQAEFDNCIKPVFSV